MGKKLIILLLCIALYSSAVAQNKEETFVRKGLVQTWGSFAFSDLVDHKEWLYSLHGFIQYFPEKRVSAMGEIMHLLGTSRDTSTVIFKSAFGVGFGYHFPVRNVDYYLFFMGSGHPMIRTQRIDSTGALEKSAIPDNMSSGATPGIIIGTGASLFVWKYLNFFVQVRYEHVKHYSVMEFKSLNNVSYSYGLGFNLHTKKQREPEAN